MTEFRIVVLPGDGIGPDVTRSAMAVAEAAAALEGFALRLEEHPAGVAAIERFGAPLSDAAMEAARSADAVFLGAVGGAQPPAAGAPRPEDAVLGLRVALDTYANLRPAICRSALAGASALRRELVEGVDLLLVREATSGAFFAEPRGRRDADGMRVAVDTWHYDEPTIRRVIERACDLAAARRGHVTSVDKANVLHTGRLWREIAEEVAARRTDVEFEHMLVDNAAAQIVGAPRRFDVIVTENLFGDILSDMFGGLVGSLGMLPSANVGDGVGMFEPVHGSAPDIAGRGIANPVGAIATIALLFRLGLGQDAAADRVDAALVQALDTGARTADIAVSEEPALTTDAFTARVLDGLERVAVPAGQ
jgi:3-isopropylmalate dehydrogenase